LECEIFQDSHFKNNYFVTITTTNLTTRVLECEIFQDLYLKNLGDLGHTKVTGPKIAHLRAETKFGGGKGFQINFQ